MTSLQCQRIMPRHARVFLLPLLAACAHGGAPKEPEVSPAALSLVHADLRLVGGETTWVARGTGYELVGRSKADILAFQPALDREAAIFKRVFPLDTIVPVIAAVRRQQPEGKPYVMRAPTPPDDRGFIVELVIPAPPDPKAPRFPALAERDPAVPVARAWLSAHASALTKTQAHSAEAKGEVDDPRVPAWAEEMIPMLGADSLVDRFTMDLALHQSQIIPLTEFFTMRRPPMMLAAAPGRGGNQNGGDRGGDRGREPPGGAGGAGGRGGMGGMGGGMGGMGGGRGGMRGGGRGGARGGGNPEGEARPAMPLPLSTMFLAQATVLGRYLSRENYELIGALADASILGQPVESTLATQKQLPLARMESDWKEWLTSRAGVLSANRR